MRMIQKHGVNKTKGEKMIRLYNALKRVHGVIHRLFKRTALILTQGTGIIVKTAVGWTLCTVGVVVFSVVALLVVAVAVPYGAFTEACPVEIVDKETGEVTYLNTQLGASNVEA